MSKKRPSPPPETCFLSEFDVPGLRWMARHPWRLATIVAGWALLVLLLGDQVGANGMAIFYKASLATSSGEKVSASVADMYGHLSTANSGPYYLLIAPLLIILVHRFHMAAGRAFITLDERGILRTSGAPWHKVVRRRNRWVGLAALLLFPIILWGCFRTQFDSLEASGAGLPLAPSGKENRPDTSQRLTNVGYVQSPNHQRWVDKFNSLASEEDKLVVIEAQELSMSGPLARCLFDELDRRNLLNDPKLGPVLNFTGGKPASLRLRDAVAGARPLVTLSAENVWPKGPGVRLGKMSEYFQGLMDTRGSDDAGRATYMGWFKAFIILDQIRIAALFTFMAWLLAKFVFYLVQLYRILPGGADAGKGKEMFLKPWARDGQGRFGLGDLFTPYNLLVLCIGVGSFYFALNFPDGGGMKAITHGSGAGSGATRVVHLLTVGAAIACMLVGPLWAYPARLRKWLEATRLKPLRQRQALTRAKFKTKPEEAEKEWMEITKEEEEILSQTTWPKGDRSFQLSMAVIFTVLLLPLGTASDLLPGGVAEYSRLPQYLREKCKAFAAKVYGLTPAGEQAEESP